jgi:hypothetical protein
MTNRFIFQSENFFACHDERLVEPDSDDEDDVEKGDVEEEEEDEEEHEEE